MTPSPHLQLLFQDAPLDPDISAALLMHDPGMGLADLQQAAHGADIPLILPATFPEVSDADGYWTSDIQRLEALRAQNADWQLVGLAQDRHGAMEMGEAGADLLLFGVFDPTAAQPLISPGDFALARWWCDIFEVPCALILAHEPDANAMYGRPGWPEFYAL